MPVGFLSADQRHCYGRYAGEPSLQQWTRYFHLNDTDLGLIQQRRGDHNRFGFALQLCTVRFLGTFLSDPSDVPRNVIWYVANQLGFSERPDLSGYRQDRTHWRHVDEIKQRYGYREFTEPLEYFRLVCWLYSRAWVSEKRPSLLFDLATARLVERKVLLPGVTVLIRLVARVRERTSQRLWRLLAMKPTALQRALLEGLQETPEGSRQGHLDQLRQGPRRVSSPALIAALERLQEIRALGVGDIDLGPFPPNRIKAMARFAAKAKAFAVACMPEERRIATLLAFAKIYEMKAMDDALEVLDLLITEILNDAEKPVRSNACGHCVISTRQPSICATPARSCSMIPWTTPRCARPFSRASPGCVCNWPPSGWPNWRCPSNIL